MSSDDEEPKTKKVKHSHTDEDDKKKISYETRCQAVNILCHPLASKKSTKKCHKLVKTIVSSSQNKKKHCLKRGVKEVVKALRKGHVSKEGRGGLAILAGDVYPVDVMSHLPILLEDHNCPYLFVPSKHDLGAAAGTKRPTSIVLVSNLTAKDDGYDLYQSLSNEAKHYEPKS